jgi:hypothetical protein
MGKGFDSSWVVPSFRGALPVRLVIEVNIIVIVPLITSFLLNTLMIMATVVNPTVHISAVDDITQVSVIRISPLAVLLWWSQTAGRVPTRTLLVVKLMTPYFAVTVEDRVNHGCCIQHHLEALYMHIDFFIVFRQVRCELIDEHS